MSTFQQRLDAARRHENAVLAGLRRRGWDADLFGQGQLPERMRAALRNFRTPVRWMPDIIAFRSYPTGLKALRYVDAKAGERWRDTGNHDLEVAALEGAERWREYSGHDVYFVFSDGMVTDPDRVREIARAGQFNHSGSGTPFVLFSRELCVHIDAVFGPPVEVA